MPQNLGQLIALLSADPTKYGKQGPELVEQLVEYQSQPDAKIRSSLRPDTAVPPAR